MKTLVLSSLLLCTLSFCGWAQPYSFELDSTDYSPIDTLVHTTDVRGSSPWAPGWISSQIKLPFSLSFLSSKQKEVYFDAHGSLFFLNPYTGINYGRIEGFNSKYLFKNDSYVAYEINTKDKYFLLEYHNYYLQSDTSVFVNFQCKIYEEGTIEIVMGPHNLNYQLPAEDAVFSGLDSNNFAWSHLLSGDSKKPIPKQGDLKASLRTFPKEGTVYRFKKVKNTSVPSIENRALAVFPNPFTSHIQLDLSSETALDLEIHDMNGKLVWHKERVDEPLIDLKHLPTGTYVLSAFSENEVVAKQVLVKK